MLGLIASYFGRSRKGRGISLLVPFRAEHHDDQRAVNWRWLKEYWRSHLPGAEIIEGEDWASVINPNLPFSKSAAVNNAARKASGDIYVIVDADGYIDIDSVLEAAKRIRHAREKGHRLWYVPYRWFYRLTRKCSHKLLESNPRHPLKFPMPPPHHCIQSTDGSQHGHWFGAMIQIMPAEAFWEVGGWDERFRGWGGEDAAAMRAMDTLFARHKTMPQQVLHVWHPMHSPSEQNKEWISWKNRIWAGQKNSNVNNWLSGLYHKAYGDPQKMRTLVNAGHKQAEEEPKK